MEHLLILLLVSALCFGLAAILLLLLVYMKFKKEIILNYIGFVGSFFLMLLGNALDIYFRINSITINKITSLIFSNISCVGAIIAVFNNTFLVNKLLGLKITNIKRIIFILIGALNIVLTIIIKFFPAEDIYLLIANIPIYSVYIYMLILGAIYLKNLGNRTLKKAVVIFYLISLVFFPFFLPLHNLVLIFMAAYFLILNILSIIFSFVYFNQPPFYKDNYLTPHFKNIFNLTDREIQVIEQMFAGLSNKEISKKLYISPKTLENHINHIYQKTNVNNRIRLINLINTNSNG